MFPRIVTSAKSHGGFLVAEGNLNEAQDRLILRAYFRPRRMKREVGVGLAPDLMTKFDPAEWGFEENSEQNATLLMLAAFGVANANAIEEGQADNLSAIAARGDVHGYSFAGRLDSLEPAPDADLWRYVAAKIWGGWRFGLSETVFDAADDLQLGLPLQKEDEDTGLRPGQLDRIAQLGIGEFWERAERGYRPNLRLIEEFPDNFPEIEPIS